MIWAALGVLIASLIAGSAGGGASKLIAIDADERVDDAIQDEAKREQVEAVIEEAQTLVARDNERAQQMAEGYAELAKRRDSTPADFEGLLSNADRDATIAQFIDLRFRLKNTVTREEWGVLFPAPGAAASEGSGDPPAGE